MPMTLDVKVSSSELVVDLSDALLHSGVPEHLLLQVAASMLRARGKDRLANCATELADAVAWEDRERERIAGDYLALF
jgi:hypothetical protein